MKSPVLYILEVLFCSGMLMAFYRLLMVRKVAFVHCRRYLVAAVVLSLVIPALDIPIYPARTVVYPVPMIAVAEPEQEPLAELPAIAADEPAQPVQVALAQPTVDWPHVARVVVAGLYLATVAVLLGLFLLHLIAIRRMRRRSRLTPCKGYTLAENPAVETPFSFLRTVFLGEGYQGRRRDIVLRHEASHVRHRHSAERIAVELVRCLVWFNPFVWIASRWLQEVQEWEADRDVLDAGYDLSEYRTIIFRQLFGYNPDIACGLNHSLTKNRFAMMTHPEKRRLTLLRFAAAVPVVAGMMMLCSFTTRTPEPPSTPSAAAVVQPAIPGLENLKPIPVHIWMTLIELIDGKPDGLECIEYLPVDNSKYLYAKNMTVTDLKGKDITWWARKHYFVKAKNPVFFIDGVRMDKEAYADWSEKRMQQNREKGIKSTPAGYSDRIYVGPEVGKLLGDPTVDALLVITTGDKPAGNTSLANVHCPLRSSTAIGAFGQQAKLTDYRHTGVDIQAAQGTEIVAAADGVVTSAGVDGNWGNCIRISHADGYSSMYAHLNTMRVKSGERVKGGDVIGTVGSTGRTTGPHLHFEMAKDGQTIDPERFFDFSKGTTRPADARVAEVRVGKNGAVIFNGQTADSKQLPDLIASWRGGLADPSTAHIVLRAEEPASENDFFDMLRVNWKGNNSTFDFDGKGSGVIRGDIDITFRDKPNESLTCDSLRVDWNSRSIECFGNVVYKTPQSVLTSAYLRASVDADGQFEWSMPKMSGVFGDRMLIQIANDGAVRVNGTPATLEQVYTEAEAFRKRTNVQEAVVVIQADPEAKMGVLTDIKDELRKAGTLRVSYSEVNGDNSVPRMLPPLRMPVDNGAQSGVRVFPTEDIAIKERNLFLVLISGSGAVMAGHPTRLEGIEADKLTGLVQTFVGNTAARSNMPEVKNEEFTLPDGRKTTWPVNYGIVALQTVRDTRFKAYLEAQRSITQAFTNVRNEVAQKWFGKAYSALSEAEKEVVARAVLLRVSEPEPRNVSKRK